jgi:hypothetical protein
MVICQGQLNRVVPLERASMPGSRSCSMGQGGLRRSRHHQGGSAGPWHDGSSKRLPGTDPEHYDKTIDLAQLPEDQEVCRACASSALIVDASAYFKVKYLAAFTCAILNNQPMGFYSVAVLVKDAQ